MSRTLLLCFVHGFKGTDNTFQQFPKDLASEVASLVPDHRVESAVYPQYETRGELADATEVFLEWVKTKVMEIRKARVSVPWPPNDREVGVILVAHSMGGFVAADALFLALSERSSNPDSSEHLFPLIQGILAFDTPYNGLSRSLFAYGAFSNYQKASTMYSAVTALTTAAPASIARLGTQTAAAKEPTPSRGPNWMTWQLLALRTGTVGAIMAGGVAAYMHREAIINGVMSVRNINKNTFTEGYRQTADALGQTYQFFSRGDLGKSFSYLSDHYTFVGALLKQKELARRLEHLGTLKGIGLHDSYTSLGENGYWNGGYFIPERTFCAVPKESHSAYHIFGRRLMPGAKDEIQAHRGMFEPEQNAGYEEMTKNSAELICQWFNNEEKADDDERYREASPEEAAEDSSVDEALKKNDANPSEEELKELNDYMAEDVRETTEGHGETVDAATIKATDQEAALSEQAHPDSGTKEEVKT